MPNNIHPREGVPWWQTGLVVIVVVIGIWLLGRGMVEFPKALVDPVGAGLIVFEETDDRGTLEIP